VTVEERAEQLVTRGNLRLRPDPRRVITVPFVPGEEMPEGDSRAVLVTERILAMDDADVTATLADVRQRFAHRHRGLVATWEENFALAARQLGAHREISAERALLMGAYFTREVAIEAAALFNPSLIAHPDQSRLEQGETRFILSLRAVGEGHVSSIEFRTGVINAAGDASVDDPGTFVEPGRVSLGPYERRLFHAKLADYNCDNAAASLILNRLDANFEAAQLEAAIAELHPDLLGRGAIGNAVDRIRWIAANNYTVEFSATSAIAERVLWPQGPSELNGMEDARFVRFVHNDGAVCYLATYTAFDQSAVTPQLLSTSDFRTFIVSQLSGLPATNKGMALFPRPVGGRRMALSRWDRERLAVATSEDGTEWAEATTLNLPPRPWELVQLGNCGSPLETPEGWLVLTHGVGPMRAYSIGAILLDLDDPRQVIATLADPLLVAAEDEREGYVPNVLYSCGGLLRDGIVYLPYGFSDSAIGFARIEVDKLLAGMTPAFASRRAAV
jgi:predicted GH43/DUF377 family glycosyl hydrolase